MEKDFNMLDDSTVGNLKISEEVIATLSKIAALEVDGVSAVAFSSASVKGFLNKSAYVKPVKVEMSGDTVGVEISLLVLFGSRIPDLASSVQKNVKTSIETMTGLTVSKVDVVIAGISDKRSELSREPAEDEKA